MYCEYKEKLEKTPISLQICMPFHPTSTNIDVKVVQKSLDYNKIEQTVTHQTVGQLIRLERKKNKRRKEPVFDDFMNIQGWKVKQEDKSWSPISDRKFKLTERRLREDEIDLLDTERPPDLPEGELNEFPAWSDMLQNVEVYAPELMLVQNDEIAMYLMKELEKHFLIWNSEPVLNFRSEYEQHLVRTRHIYFDKRPFWMFDQNYQSASQNISNTLLVHRAISNHFWTKVVSRLTYPWDNLLLNQLTVQDLNVKISEYLKNAMKVTNFDWALEICEILLEKKECWIEDLSDELKRNQFFNSIASLQAKLLRDLIYDNVEILMNELTKRKNNSTFYVKVDMEALSTDSYSAWAIAKRLIEIGEDIVRVECRLFPNMYPDEKTFSVASSVIMEKFSIEPIRPFQSVFEGKQRLDEAVAHLGEIEGVEDVAEAVRLAVGLRKLAQETKVVRVFWFREPYEFDFTEVKRNTLESIKEMRDKLHSKASTFLYDTMKDIVDFYTWSSRKLYGQDQLVQMYKLVEVRDHDFPKLKKKLDILHECFGILFEEFNFNEIMLQKYYTSSRSSFRLSYLITLVWQKLMVDKARIEKVLTEKTNAVHYESMMLDENLRLCVKKYRVCHSTSDLTVLASRFEEIHQRVERLQVEFPILAAQLELFEMDPLKDDVDALAFRAKVISHIAGCHIKVVQFEEEFVNTKVVEVDVPSVNEQIETMNTDFETLKKEIGEPEDELVLESAQMFLQKIQVMMDQFNKVLPVINALRSRGIKARHWHKILGETDGDVPQDHENMTVLELTKIDFQEKDAKKCEEVSELASKELVLEESLTQMKAQLAEVTLTHNKNHLTGVFEMEIKPETVGLVEELIIKTQMNISSPFVTSLLPLLKEWLEKLQRLQNMMDLHQKCMSKWIYLEPLFAAEDIAYQMPEEWRKFQDIRERWKYLTEQLSRVRKLADLSEINCPPEIMQLLDMFKVIQKGFDVYLQKRKFNYPRLYFLSNNELLEMLSRARNPEKVQPYLCKMFASVYGLEVRNQCEIVAVLSQRGERLKLSKAINIHHFKRHVDKWLAELEREIKNTVKNKLKNVMRMCGEDLPSIFDLTGDFTAQSVILHCRLVATKKIENGIVTGKLPTLLDYFDLYIEKLIKGRSDSEEEKLLIDNLLIEYNDQKGIVNRLIKANCKSIHNFEWTSQIRHYWMNDDLYVRVYNLNVLYGYEYISSSTPFVMTPIIRKVHRELMTFQTQGYAGMLKGPAATGKSESIKELAKILGKFNLVFNCSPNVDRHQLEDLMCGTILSGTTLCLDEFNRLSEKDMAWFSSHLLGIYQAMTTKNAKYRVRNLQIPVSPSAAFYLTINPKFLARSNLPANIYSIVRGISMNFADIRSIANAFLLLAGFQNSEKETNLLCSVFEQCQTLLAPMHHYDFQLRTALATINETLELMKGQKRGKVDVRVIGKALRNVLEPYIVHSDVSSFEKIMGSAFEKPNFEKQKDEIKAKEVIKETIEQLGLIATEKFVDCCYSILHLSRQRQAFILLGPTMSGKSTALKVLRRVMKPLLEINCKMFRMNPSQNDSHYLYGYYDSNRFDWMTGILTMKLETKLEKDEEGWLVLDGVLDSVWVESLNSLFDSNQKLCLANGENVPLNPGIRVVFECDSLDKVAPSTVSRCQVIYFDEETVPLSAFLSSISPVIYQKVVDAMPHLSILRKLNRKLLYDRIGHLSKMFSKNKEIEESIWTFLSFIAARTVKEEEHVDKWLQGLEVDTHSLIWKVPMVFGGAKTVRDEENEHLTNYNFKREIIKQMVMFSKYLVVIYGLSGSGKDEFVEQVIGGFEPARWDIHYLNLSSDLVPVDLYNSIMNCNLVRLGPNHYTGAGDKSVLVVLQGFERLPVLSNNSVMEFLRSLFDFGRVLNPAKETVRFTSVYFLIDYTTEIVGPQHLPIPDRLRRHMFPVLFHQTNKTLPYEVGFNFLQVYRTESQEPEQIDAFKECLMKELVTATSDIPHHIVPLCHKLMTCLEDMIDETFFQSNESFPFTLLQLPDDEVPSIFDYPTLENRISEYLRKKGKTEVLHSYLIRQFGFLYKIAQLPIDGHCVLIGEPENEPAKMIELVADVSDIYLEAAPSQMTEIYWKETMVKVIQMCTKENRKVLLHVTDDMPSHDCLDRVFADLSVILSGGFPMRLFQQQASGNAMASISSIASEWDKRKVLTRKMRENLHVIITVNRRTVGHHRSVFYELFHFCMMVNLDNWTNDDMLSYASMNLAQLNLPAEQVRRSVADLMKIHKLMVELHPKFEHSEFVSFIQTYCHMVTRKKEKLNALMTRYQTGIEKLNKADEQMNYMQEELVRLQPELVRTSLETTMLMSQIERETIEIENAREIVAANEFKANEAATKAQALKVECEAELAEAIPALEASVQALEVLSQRDISMLKTMKNPPQAVRLCMEAVCILLGEQPVKVKHERKSKLDYWPTALKCLADMQFLRRIRLFAREKVPPNVMNIIRKNYISLEEFSPAVIRATSVAAEGLCLWVRAIESYDTISKQVEPKKQRLKNAEMMVKSNMKALDAKRKALADVTERLQHLSDVFSQQSQKKQDLQNQIQACEQRVGRAAHLLAALGGERSRWEKNIRELEKELQIYRKTVLIAAAIITYLGNVEDTIRKKAVSLTAAAVRYEKAFTMRVILDHTSILYDEKVCVVNVSLGRNVIQENVMNLFLSVNVAEMTQKRDELSDEKTSFLIQLDALEERIMDVLGKSKDLDNDRVMDMLGGVRELSQSYESRSFELNSLEERLDRLSKKFRDLAVFASRLIFISMNLSKLSPFYLRTLKFYFNVFREAVQSDAATLNEGKVEEVKAKVLKAFNEKITNSLFAQHRAVFEFLTKHDIGYDELKDMSEKEFLAKYMKYMDPTDLNLRQTIIEHDSRVPIAILLNAQSTYVVRNLYSISRQVERIEPKNSMDPNHNPTRIQMAPIENLKSFDWKTCLLDDQWIMVQV
uniref:DNA-directed DNA polymerase n=1 Tax=Bursaphelenchus xylophilus TaxID=6326 RepID=A0A1I7RZM0_BURXY